MRALSLRTGSVFGRGVLATITTSRCWASTEPPKENQTAETEKGDAKQAKETAPLTQEVFAKLEKELEKAREDISELKRETLYRAADAENARRIGREDVEKAKAYGISSFGKDMLEVVDILEKGLEAMANVPVEELESKSLSSIHTGVKLSEKVLLNNLAKYGIERMDVKVGSVFDPNHHDALLKTPPTAEAPSGHISKVLKTGYKIRERILRAPQVGVSSED
ncbi:co-chaperone GrpE [Trypanosoma grayi]|uniref:co-chaperone GrpE n=1 Tax=Trypanosoma grayi TaxID=71804 RepID=UPI0004F428BB|nr:co-chaperone GrpE [Trypanosoma grayi]KEG13043.1 co-chaperone GrpE [Trypanosoma grayi]